MDSSASEATADPRLFNGFGNDLEQTVRIVALVIAVVFCAGFLPIALAPGWAPRMAALLFAMPLGLMLLVGALRRRDHAALALAAGLAWCVVATGFHTAPALRLFGMIGLEASVLIYVGAAACWAIGRSLDGERGHQLLQWLVIGAVSISGVVGFIQVVVQIGEGPFVLNDGRAHGLTTYSIYLGSLSSCALVLLATMRVQRRYWGLQLVGVFALAVASGLSGSRAALGAAVLSLAYVVYRRRDLVSAVAAGCLVAGTLAASWLTEFFASSPDEPSTGTPSGSTEGASSLQRLGENDGLPWRIDGWKAGFEAWRDRPITGWGVGNFRQAIQGFVGSGFEQSTPRFDAHNIFVELLVAVGLPGLVLFAVFGVLCARSARGPLAIAAVTLAWSWLLQPSGLSTLPLALLLLGASMPRIADAEDGQPRIQRLTPVALALGVVLFLGFSAIDLRMSLAVDEARPGPLESVSFAYPFDPTYSDMVAQTWMVEWRILQMQGSEDDAAIQHTIERTLTWSRRSIDRQPDAPRWYDALAIRLGELERYDEAIDVLEESLRLQPGRTRSQILLGQLQDRAAAALLAPPAP